jgi:hypothetical protein
MRASKHDQHVKRMSMSMNGSFVGLDSSFNMSSMQKTEKGREGWLWRQGGLFGWKKRYFVLNGTVLSRFEDKNGASGKARGTVLMRGRCSVERVEDDTDDDGLVLDKSPASTMSSSNSTLSMSTSKLGLSRKGSFWTTSSKKGQSSSGGSKAGGGSKASHLYYFVIKDDKFVRHFGCESEADRNGWVEQIEMAILLSKRKDALEEQKRLESEAMNPANMTRPRSSSRGSRATPMTVARKEPGGIEGTILEETREHSDSTDSVGVVAYENPATVIRVGTVARPKDDNPAAESKDELVTDPPANEEDPDVLNGYLWKMKQVGMGSSKRYFELHDVARKLYFFPSWESSEKWRQQKKTPASSGIFGTKKKQIKHGHIDLNTVTAVESSQDSKAMPFSMDLRTGNRVWTLSAESEDDYVLWFHAITAAVFGKDDAEVGEDDMLFSDRQLYQIYNILQPVYDDQEEPDEDQLIYLITEQRGVQRLLLELQEAEDDVLISEAFNYDKDKDLEPNERVSYASVAMQGLIFSNVAANVFIGDVIGRQMLAMVCVSSLVPVMVSTLVSEGSLAPVDAHVRGNTSLGQGVFADSLISGLAEGSKPAALQETETGVTRVLSHTLLLMATICQTSKEGYELVVCILLAIVKSKERASEEAGMAQEQGNLNVFDVVSQAMKDEVLDAIDEHEIQPKAFAPENFEFTPLLIAMLALQSKQAQEKEPTFTPSKLDSQAETWTSEHSTVQVKAAVAQLLCSLVASVEDLGQRMAMRTSFKRQGLWESMNILKVEYAKAMQYVQAETPSAMPPQHASQSSISSGISSISAGSPSFRRHTRLSSYGGSFDDTTGLVNGNGRKSVRNSTMARRKMSTNMGHSGFIQKDGDGENFLESLQNGSDESNAFSVTAADEQKILDIDAVLIQISFYEEAMIMDEQEDEKKYDPSQLHHVTERIERLVTGTPAQDDIVDLLATLVHTLQTLSEDVGDDTEQMEVSIDGKEAVSKFLQSNTHKMDAMADDKSFYQRPSNNLALPGASSKVDMVKWAKVLSKGLKGASSAKQVITIVQKLNAVRSMEEIEDIGAEFLDDDDSDDGSDAGSTESPVALDNLGSGLGLEKKVDPRNALMGALAKRGGGGDAAPDPRNALMGALAKRGGGGNAAPDPRNALMGALAKRGGGAVPAASKPAAGSDSKYAKYTKMKKMGLPEGPIRQSMMKDAVPADEIEVFFGNAPKKSGAPSKEEMRTKYPKYVKMLGMGLPEGPVRQSMMKDAVPVDEIEIFFGNAPKSCGPTKEALRTKYPKYVKMLGMGLPEGPVRNSMMKDSIPSDEIEIFFGADSGPKKVVVKAGPPKPVLSPEAQKFVDSLPTPSTAVKMTAFHWTKLPHSQVNKSMWPKLLAKSSSNAKIDSKRLEALFGSEVAKPKSADGEDKPEGGEASDQNSSDSKKLNFKEKKIIISRQRGQNVAISLRKLKATKAEGQERIKRALLALDVDMITLDQLEIIKLVLPERAEIQSIRDAIAEDKSLKEPDRLGDCEAFFLSIQEVPRVGSKVDAFQFKLKVDGIFEQAHSMADTMLEASEEVKKSDRLKRILTVVLMMGNFLNANSYRGAATAFRLESLMKLSQVRSKDPQASRTLLHYIVSHCEEHDSDVLSLGLDFPTIGKASRKGLFQMLESNVKDIEAGITVLQREITGSGPQSEFTAKVSKFSRSVQERLEELNKKIGMLREQQKELATMFGESTEGGDGFTFDDLFPLVASFIEAFKRAVEENSTQKLKEKRLQKLTLEREKRQKMIEGRKARADAKDPQDRPSKGGGHAQRRTSLTNKSFHRRYIVFMFGNRLFF